MEACRNCNSEMLLIGEFCSYDCEDAWLDRVWSDLEERAYANFEIEDGWMDIYTEEA